MPKLIFSYILILAAATLAVVGWWQGFWFGIGATIAFGVVAVVLAIRCKATRNRWQTKRQADSPNPPALPRESTPVDLIELGSDTHNMIEELLSQKRYALLLRPQLISHLTSAQVTRALTALDAEMAMIDAGSVEASFWLAQNRETDHRKLPLEAYFLDRYPVTNRQYKAFLNAGGYQQQGLWEPSVWPCVDEFLDSTAELGPRFWQNGSYPTGEDDLPVVGVNWHEARAYGNWIGKRLPTDAEWVKAAAWPVSSGSNTKPVQRRFPWGDSMDRTRAQLWSPKKSHRISVFELASGANPTSVYHLIGNVWEWMFDDFAVAETTRGDIEFNSPMKSLRGGAFDTYFSTQAASQFQSGEGLMHRKHNVGFRCAIQVADLALGSPTEIPNETPADESAKNSLPAREQHVVKQSSQETAV